MDRPDVIVVGAGFGGLGCALSLCERGLRPLVLEALRYPGGCASTFQRDGYLFESGATLFSGLGPTQLFGRWIVRHEMPVRVQWLDPVVELRTPGRSLALPRSRAAFVDSLAALAGARAQAVRDFFSLQAKVADALWPILDAPELLPPLSLSSLLRHAKRLGTYSALLPLIGRPLSDVFRRLSLLDFEPLTTWARALCQITVQCPPEEAEAPIALSALDYPWRGTGHVVAGIGELAQGMAGAIERLGGSVRYAERVRRVQRTEAGAYRVTTSRGAYEAPFVAANVLPEDYRTLLGNPPEIDAALGEVERGLRSGWGAAMLYLVARAPADAPVSPHHLELVDEPSEPFLEGNHLFVSVSGAGETRRAPEGRRTLTVSTHVRPPLVQGLTPEQAAAYIAKVQDRMRETLRRRAPEWAAGIEHELPASPRTFARFTRRTGGFVGGVPRRAGWRQYLHMTPLEPVRGCWMVGDSVFPGQSILAAAVGGTAVARVIARRA